MSSIDQRLRRILTVLLAATGLILLAGCATSDDTDIPWNAPQPWEGSPFLPGINE